MNDRTKRDTETARARTTQDADRASRGIQAGRVGDAREANPSFQEREQAAGMYLANNDPLEGRRNSGGPFDGVPLPGSVDGPINPRDSEDGQEVFEITPAVAGQKQIHPFQLVDVSEEGSPRIAIRYGTVNSIVPTLGGTPLSPDVENGPFQGVSGNTSFWLRVNLNTTTQAVTSAVIQNSEPSTNKDTAAILIGSITYSGGEITAIANAVTASLSLASCGTTHVFGRV